MAQVRNILTARYDVARGGASDAIRAAQAIDIRFSSIDVVRVSGEWKVLEINSGVMMETLGAHHPALVAAAYAAALDKVFEQSM